MIGDRAGAAARRTLRVSAALCAMGSIVFVGVLAVWSPGQWSQVALWWHGLCVVVFMLIPGAIGVLVRIDHAADRLRLALRAWTPLILIALATMPSALVDGTMPLDLGAPWILSITPLAAAVAATGWPDPRAFIIVIASSVLVAIGRIGASPQSILDVATQDALVALVVGSVVAVLVMAALRASVELDRQSAELAAAAAARAESLGRAQERVRIVGDVHDGILAALLGAGRTIGPMPPSLVDAAQRLLALDAALTEAESAPVGLGEFVDQVRTAAAQFAPDALVESTVGAHADADLPALVVEAMLGAAAEALRNSVRHARSEGRATRREVIVRATPAEVVVEIRDDGRGMVEASVEPTRLGVRASILARMSDVDGGSAAISSSAERGTTVELRWSRR